MTVSPWQRRIERAQELSRQHPFAAEILGFYIHVARFQEDLHQRLSEAFTRKSPTASFYAELNRDELDNLLRSFESFLFVTEAHGPKALAELSHELRARGQNFWTELLQSAWTAYTANEAAALLASAFLQPYAELLRCRAMRPATSSGCALCPFCNRKPGSGVLRQLGEGGARSMICSFCVAEWEFRRIVCPGCGEENDKMLPVFTASDFDYVRLECCDSCKTYIKTVDLTKNGRAEPVVDELASAPLDLWAREHGYAKLQNNLLGM